MQKNYKIKLGTQEIEITQDEDGKFIKPLFIIELEKEGTALKPAVEPIVVARKPLSEKNVALNVLKWGTGGINIDESRIGYVSKEDKDGARWGNQTGNINDYGKGVGAMGGKDVLANSQGRFPANIILDEESAKMLDEQTGDIGCSSDREKYKGSNYGNSMFLGEKPLFNSPTYTDKGGASRFFYCAKASKSERNEGCEELPYKKAGGMQGRNDGSFDGNITYNNNHHPTVKPIKLMEYLIKLVSKENAVILDPFLGSGTTAIACLKTNRKFIGIEKEPDYVKIAEARIKPYLEQKKL